jgi:proline iminopeptidase
LVDDIERIRKHLGVERWIVFGGSWGATLSLIYAQTHPAFVSHLVLRGVFLMTQTELDWFYGGGASRFFPEEWQKFAGLLPLEEQNSIISAYAKRLFGENASEQIRFAQAWTGWETALASLESSVFTGTTPAAYAKAFACIENHYFSNKGFLEADGQIMRDMERIKDIPGTIVQGRYDMICPPETAYRLHKAWPTSRLLFASRAGHSLSEPQITSALVQVMDDLA